MSDEQSERFVDSYYPAYDLCTEYLRESLFPNEPDKHLRIIVGRGREFIDSKVL